MKDLKQLRIDVSVEDEVQDFNLAYDDPYDQADDDRYQAWLDKQPETEGDLPSDLDDDDSIPF